MAALGVVQGTALLLFLSIGALVETTKYFDGISRLLFNGTVS